MFPSHDPAVLGATLPVNPYPATFLFAKYDSKP